MSGHVADMAKATRLNRRRRTLSPRVGPQAVTIYPIDDE